MSADKVVKRDKRRTIGGRGREWAHKCHKLLEAMLELDESEPFRHPVDSIRYPDYYNVISESMDLSKVMVNLHTGQYFTISNFADDVRLIFSNWEKYNSDAKSEVFVNRMRLSWWFESEFKKIEGSLLSRPIQMPSSPNSQRYTMNTGNGTVLMDLSPQRPVTPTPPSTSAIPTIVATNTPCTKSYAPAITVSNSNTTTRIVAPPIHRNRTKPAGPKDEYAALLNTLRKLQDCSKRNAMMDTDVVVAIRSGMCTVIPQAPGACITVNTSGTSGISAITPDSAAITVNAGSTATTLNSRPARTIDDDATVVVLPETPEVADSMEPPLKRSKSHATEPKSTAVLTDPRTTATVNNSIERPKDDTSQFPPVKLDVTHIWFAMCKNKPQKPVFLTESGFLLHLRKDNNDVRFAIRADEIVRCVAHLGNSKKQMIFVFVTPTCEKKLKTLTEATGILDETQRSRSCSLIVMFLESLTPSSISRLVHVFWNIGQKSLFGPVFTEVDQQGALQLLANIKPHIMERVSHRTKPDGVPNVSSNTNDINGNGDQNHSTNKQPITSSLNTRQPHHRKSSRPQRIERPASEVTSPGDELPAGIAEQLFPTAGQVVVSSDNGSNSISNSDSEDRVNDLEDNREVNYSPLNCEQVINSVHCIGTIRENCSSIPLESYRINLTGSRVRGSEETLGSDSDLEIVIPTDSEAAEILQSVEGKKASRQKMMKKSGLDMHMKPFIIESSLLPECEDVVMLQEKISLKCPITQQLMRCPMKNKHCGHSYDKEGAEGLISNRSGKARCPVPGCSNKVPLIMQDMNVDITLMEVINDKTKL